MGSVEHGKLTALEKFLIVAYYPFMLAVLVWFAIHLANPWYGWFPLVLEALLAVVMGANTWVAWRLYRRVIPDRGAGDRTVDFFITTLDEGEQVLRRTIRQTLKVTAPETIWILDDGQRPAVRRLCERYGVRYVTRDSRENAKAGNLNHALSKSQADLVAVFDADGFPARDFLKGTVALFDDPKVAVVQVNQICYYPDAFQFAPRFSLHQLWHEQSFFYDLILPGKQARNAATWCGNGALLRRAALESIGGVTTGSIAEDIETSYRLCAEGWKIEYVEEPKAFNLAPAGVDGYIRQRNRWEMGFFRTLRTEGPGLVRSKLLSTSQKVTHILNPLNYYVESVPRFLMLFIPFVLIASPTPVFDVPVWSLAILWLVIQWRCWMYLTVSRGRGTNAYTGAFWMIKGSLYFFNLLRAPFFNRTPFRVTSKEARGQNRIWGWVVILMSAVAFLGLSLSLHALWLDVRFDTLSAFVLSLFLSGCSVGALKLVYRSRLASFTAGHFMKVPIRVEGGGECVSGFTRFVSPTRLEAFLMRPPISGSPHQVFLTIEGREIELRANPLPTKVRFQDETPFFYVQFDQVNLPDWNAVEDYGFSKTPAQHLGIDSEAAQVAIRTISGEENSLSSHAFWGSGFRSLVRILERANAISRQMIFRRASAN